MYISQIWMNCLLFGLVSMIQNIAKNADIPRIPGIPGIPGITVTSQGRHRELLGQLIKNERHKPWNQIYIHNR